MCLAGAVAADFLATAERFVHARIRVGSDARPRTARGASGEHLANGSIENAHAPGSTLCSNEALTNAEIGGANGLRPSDPHQSAGRYHGPAVGNHMQLLSPPPASVVELDGSMSAGRQPPHCSRGRIAAAGDAGSGPRRDPPAPHPAPALGRDVRGRENALEGWIDEIQRSSTHHRSSLLR